ncbi:isocitrate/isopropylmalate dehydrogenase family protein [Caldithrix abyssi]|uniref:Isocitrate dehydrogenase (NAD+) n=1 Tax=Caldithrix abyssi DSM 13497 TaxID=880073 RepID=H1XYT7_CALAY|nr:isocitrate/isopropylmalate dehydrogenase family protein [Caldithrix abyssi]APF20528.1 isocitrate dehydrogenase (NAD+) [Caldithrix abyssi DSM 13497]EHO40956.1 isocitrate/isopropylmalate dehydrogenase [Caldithrix abyssi DSM 13497]
MAQKEKVYQITLIPGDGIGPEVTSAARKVLAAAGVVIDWEMVDAGAGAINKHGTTLPDETIESIRKNKVALKGPLTTPIGEGFKSVNVQLRKTLDLYANIRPVRSALGITFQHKPIDLVIFRENTEDLYAGLEYEIAPGVTQSLKIITEKASTRIARAAFEWARQNKRKMVHAVHKANIMKKSDGLFLDCVRKVAKEYPEIAYKEIIVDNCAMQMVMRPDQFDVVVLGNLYGDIISDLAAGLVGGLGVVPGANIGDEVAIFESVHGSAPDIAGKGVANPIATILSANMMLRHIGEGKAADRIQAALVLFLAERKHLTPDLGGRATTDELVDGLIEKIKMLR